MERRRPDPAPEQTTEGKKSLAITVSPGAEICGQLQGGMGRKQINCVFFAGCEVFAEAATLSQREALPVAVVSSENILSRSRATKLAAPEGFFMAALCAAHY